MNASAQTTGTVSAFPFDSDDVDSRGLGDDRSGEAGIGAGPRNALPAALATPVLDFHAHLTCVSLDDVPLQALRGALTSRSAHATWMALRLVGVLAPASLQLCPLLALVMRVVCPRRVRVRVSGPGPGDARAWACPSTWHYAP